MGGWCGRGEGAAGRALVAGHLPRRGVSWLRCERVMSGNACGDCGDGEDDEQGGVEDVEVVDEGVVGKRGEQAADISILSADLFQALDSFSWPL